ncbi:MAG: ADP-forming succinate--CoA ligase subunit beta [Pyrodictiaceae archaeon]
MKLFEYEAKEILAALGAKVPRGIVVSDSDDIEAKIRSAGLKPPLAVKAQVLVAGRGKAGGIKIVESIDDAIEATRKLLASRIKGIRVRKVLVEEAVKHEKEYFASITIDRAKRRPVILVSDMGGMDIEEIAKEHPEAIRRYYVDPFYGLHAYEARKLGKEIGFRGRLLTRFTTTLMALYKAFEMYDAELVESNPFTVVGEDIVLLDARIIVDDNALYRHRELTERNLEETGEFTEWEVKARSQGLAFVELDGDIGVIGNGAGLTMATMDLVSYFGGKPAVFLDIGGGASAELVKKAVSILLEMPKVKKILINVFGGITRCDEVAKGIIAALEEAKAKKPIVVRLVGTNEEEGRRILEEHGVKAFADPIEAVKTVIAL